MGSAALSGKTFTVSRGPTLICPRDHGALEPTVHGLYCAACGSCYPVIRGVPILIDDEASVFARGDYSGGGYLGAAYGTDRDRTSGLRRAYRRVMHRMSEGTVRVSPPISEFIQHVCKEALPGPILVIGAGDMEFEDARFVYTDVSFGRHVTVICDAHQLPYANGAFAGAVMVAVLEHVADPVRCVSEIHRVLADGGLVYADTPFLQPVHMGAYDFTRFTYLGHRRLFRWFDDIDSGVSIGPSAALGHSIAYTLRCFGSSKRLRQVIGGLGVILAFLIRQLDRIVGSTQAAYDAAGGVYFLGRRRNDPIPDRAIIRLYRGSNRP